MSDIEDGEVISSDEEIECNFGEDKESNIILLNENNLQINDNNRWNYEQNNIKVENSVTSEDNYTDTQYNKGHGNRDHQLKRDNIPYDYNFNRRKRRSDHLSTEETSSFQNDLQSVKRRILCKYYAAGDCKSGSTCTFMHGDFPCKFFHDEHATCRAGNHCKFSHSPLTEEMKIVLDGFIQDGKEKLSQTCHIPIAIIPTFSNDSFITINSSRPNCLLPTPTNIKPMIMSNYDSDFNVRCDSFNNDFNFCYESYNNEYYDNIGYPETNYTEPSQIFHKKSIFDGDIPNYPIANKSQFQQNMQYVSEENHLDKDHRNINQFSGCLDATPIFQKPLYNIINSDDFNTYFETNNTYIEDSSQFSNDENITPQIIPEKVNLSYTNIKNQINYKNQAPARFIVGNFSNCIKTEPEIQTSDSFDIDFRNALKKLAEQVVDTQNAYPNLKNSIYDKQIEKNQQISVNNVISQVDTSSILKNIVKTETSDVRIDENASTFKHENDLSESEKMYIQEMKSLINLDAQFENVIHWNLHKLHVIKKQPYTLFKFKVEDLHDNPLADPRLHGHPFLNNCCKKEELQFSNNEEDYNDVLNIKDELNTDQSEESNCYLFNDNFRKKKLFESMF